MGNFLRMEKQQQIQALIQLGWSDRRIGREISVNRETVGKYRKGFQNQPEVPADENGEKPQNQPNVSTDHHQPEVQNQPEVPTESEALPPTNSEAVAPHVSTIKRKLDQRLSAQRIYQDLVEKYEYRGSYDSIKRYARKLRKRFRKYYERLEHLPGKEAQVDFTKSPCLIRKGKGYRKVWLFKMTLSCSKHAYEELVEKQDLETFIRCHERAFRFFGGVPEIVTLDNLKAGVLKACLYDPILNRTYYAFSMHWGFAVNPCVPRAPEHKGVVERDIRYTKDNALKGLRFESLEEGNERLRYWNKRWARTRIHGSTKQQVWRMFCEVERPLLRVLAEKPFAYFEAGKRMVDVDGMIEVRSGYYAVPPQFINQEVIVHFNSEWVMVYKDEILLITHKRHALPGKVSAPASCKPPWKHPSLESQQRYYLRVARQVGPNLHEVVYRIMDQDHPLSIRRIRGLLSLRKNYSNVILDTAASQALDQRVYSYHYVKNICFRLQENVGKLQPAALTQQHDLIRDLADYETLVNERTS